MKRFFLIGIAGLIVFFLCGCDPETTNPPGSDTPNQLPHQQKGYFSIHCPSTGLNDSILITTAELVDTVSPILFCNLTFGSWPNRHGISLGLNGSITYPFHSGGGPVLPGESQVYRTPHCGHLDSDVGGWYYGSIGGLDPTSEVQIIQFNSAIIEGTYHGQFDHVGISTYCYSYPLDTVYVWGSFKTTF
jgi:hypothetical protein